MVIDVVITMMRDVNYYFITLINFKELSNIIRDEGVFTIIEIELISAGKLHRNCTEIALKNDGQNRSGTVPCCHLAAAVGTPESK